MNTKELSPNWLQAFFEKLQYKNTNPGIEDNLPNDLPFIIWTGGEPFLSFPSLVTGLELAANLGFHSEILTSGIWYVDKQEAGYLEQLLEHVPATAFSLRLSLDAEHQETVPLTKIFALVEKATRIGIEVNFTLRRMPGSRYTPGYYRAEIEKALPGFYQQNRDRSRWIHMIPHIPVRPTASSPASTTGGPVPSQRKWQKPCSQGFIDLICGEDGWIYPCCGLFSLPFYQQFRVGDPLHEGWPAILAKRDNNPLFRILREKGPYGICQELELNPAHWDWPVFQGPCHLCLALFYYHGERVIEHYNGTPSSFDTR